jgi:hypothetical protein
VPGLSVVIAPLAAPVPAPELSAAVAILSAVVIALATATAISTRTLEIRLQVRILQFLADQAVTAIVVLVATIVLAAAAPTFVVPAPGIDIADERADTRRSYCASSQTAQRRAS